MLGSLVDVYDPVHLISSAHALAPPPFGHPFTDNLDLRRPKVVWRSSGRVPDSIPCRKSNGAVWTRTAARAARGWPASLLRRTASRRGSHDKKSARRGAIREKETRRPLPTGGLQERGGERGPRSCLTLANGLSLPRTPPVFEPVRSRFSSLKVGPNQPKEMRKRCGKCADSMP